MVKGQLTSVGLQQNAHSYHVDKKRRGQQGREESEEVGGGSSEKEQLLLLCICLVTPPILSQIYSKLNRGGLGESLLLPALSPNGGEKSYDY